MASQSIVNTLWWSAPAVALVPSSDRASYGATGRRNVFQAHLRVLARENDAVRAGPQGSRRRSFRVFGRRFAARLVCRNTNIYPGQDFAFSPDTFEGALRFAVN